MSGLTGVDISAGFVRVARTGPVQSNGLHVVTHLGAAPLPAEAVVAGTIHDPAAVARALVKALKDARLPRTGLVFGLAGTTTGVDVKLLPDSVKPEERAAALRYRANLDTPPGLAKDSLVLALDTVRYETTGEGARLARVMVGMADREQVEQVQRVAQIARATVRAIDLAPSALARAAVRTAPDSTTVTTLVDIGKTKLTVATLEGTHLRSLRTVAGRGGDSLTQAVVTAGVKEFEAAESYKLHTKVGEATAATASQRRFINAGPREDRSAQTSEEAALSAATDALIAEVSASIAADRKKHGGAPTQGVYLYGGGALMGGLAERMRIAMGMTVAYAGPRVTLGSSRRLDRFRTDSGAPDPRLMLAMATAFGLSLWKEPS